jgi:hypothetical protein
MRNWILTGLLLVAITGCVSEQTVVTPSNEPVAVAIPYTDILIFQYPPKNRTYTELGRIEASTVSISSDEVVYRKLQREASDLKANAIIMSEEGIYIEGGYKNATAIAVDMPITYEERRRLLQPARDAASTGEGEVIY